MCAYVWCSLSANPILIMRACTQLSSSASPILIMQACTLSSLQSTSPVSVMLAAGHNPTLITHMHIVIEFRLFSNKEGKGHCPHLPDKRTQLEWWVECTLQQQQQHHLHLLLLSSFLVIFSHVSYKLMSKKRDRTTTTRQPRMVPTEGDAGSSRSLARNRTTITFYFTYVLLTHKKHWQILTLCSCCCSWLKWWHAQYVLIGRYNKSCSSILKASLESINDSFMFFYAADQIRCFPPVM